MKRTVLVLLALAGLSLAACAPRAPDPDRFATKFFEHGKDTLLDVLKDQNVGEEKLKAATDILNRYEKDTEHNIAAAMRAQQELMLALTSGRNSATLLKLEADQARVREQALRGIGRMHEELESTVGDQAWKGASTQLEKKYSRFFKPRN